MTLRWRLMVIGVAGLSAGLLLGGWLVLAALRLSLDRSVDASAASTAADVSSLIAAGQLPQPVPVAGTQLVQVIQFAEGQDRVRAGSPGADRLVPIVEPAELSQALLGQHLQIGGARAGLPGTLRVSARAAGPASQRLSVVVAVPMEDAERAMRAMRLALLSLFVPLVAGLAAVAWWVIGRTLRPVEALRASAEGITGQPGAAPGDRLPVPVGGDEIHRLAVTLNGMLDRLAGARQRQRQFVADAAHELRNPLAGMRTQLEVAQRHPEAMDWAEVTDDLLADTQRLSALAEDLLLLAGSDEAAGADPVSAVTPGSSVNAVLDGLVSRYRGARVPVRLRPGHDTAAEVPALEVVWPPDDLHRVLTNLLDNAVRHASSAVSLDAGRRDRKVWITVTDDGPGIPAGDRQRVFGRFVRLDDARAADEGGAGLGLAIVAELLRRHASSIRLSDAEPGLRAELLLPAAV